MSKKPKMAIYRDNAGEWRWRLRAANTKIVSDSAEGYKTRHGAVQAVEALYRILAAAEIVVMPDARRALKVPKISFPRD